jgi:hypothetical protein
MQEFGKPAHPRDLAPFGRKSRRSYKRLHQALYKTFALRGANVGK